MNLISIDPGKSGAFARWTMDGELLQTEKVRVPPKQRYFDKKQLDILSSLVEEGDIIVTEGLLDKRIRHNSPIAVNTMAINFGMQRATCILNKAKKIEVISPWTWKKDLGLSKDKHLSIRLARELVDHSFLRKQRMRVDDVDICEAILIGIYYGRSNLQWTI